MNDLERFLSKFEDDGYEFDKPRQRAWGLWIVGTRPRGGGGRSTITGLLGSALGLTHCTVIGRFDEGVPSVETFRAFLKEASKFVKENTAKYEFESVIALSSEKPDRRALTPVLREADEKISNLLDFRVISRSKESVPQAAPKTSAPASPPPPPEPSITTSNLDYEALSKALPSPTARERVLYAWEVVLPDSPDVTSQTYLVVTQERGLLMKKLGAYFSPELDFRWEQTGEPTTAIDAGGPVLRIYDGTREHRLRNKDAQFIQVLLHHLKYAREGWVSGHMSELGFDSELVDRCRQDFVAERYALAVRNAFALLETRIRKEAAAPREVSGVELAKFAFHPETGRIPVGISPGEKEGTHLLFRGAFLAFRDAAAHNDELTGLSKSEAFHQIAVVDLLLKLTHEGSEQLQRGSR